MPELPEVETIVRGLRNHYLDLRIESVQMTGHPMFEENPKSFCRRLGGRTIEGFERHGKSIYMLLGDLSLRIHLGMTGQLLVKTASDAMESHTHLVFKFEKSDKQLRYRDIRRFGEMEIIEGTDQRSSVPDAWKISPEELKASIRKISGYLKHGLLSQRFVAGLGNIYVDEALFKAKLHPKRSGTKLRASQWDSLTASIREVLGDSIERGGTSFSNYVDVQGSRGGFKQRLSVYGKAGKPCSCGTKIKKIVFAGRGTHFCPRCQPSPR
jgi:formamidopyrimidine-DNA glycosylase